MVVLVCRGGLPWRAWYCIAMGMVGARMVYIGEGMQEGHALIMRYGWIGHI
jgi:hypothetical protein